MPFFENAKDVTINHSTMTDVKGDFHHHNNSRHVNNHDSNNKTTRSTTNSHNDSSIAEEGNQNTNNTYKDGRRVIRGMVHTTVRNNNRSSPLATSVPHTSPRRSDMNAARPTEGVRQRNLDGRGYESSTPRRENGPNRLLEERRSYMHGSAEHSWAESLRQPNFDEQEYEYQRRPEERRMYSGAGHQRQGNMYEPAERILRENSDEDEPYDDYPPAPAKRTGDRRPMRRRAGQTHREYHDMEVDDYPEEAPLPSKFSSPGRPSLNPFYSQPAPSPPFPTPTTAQYASKSEPQFAPPQSFDEFTDSAWGNK